jgi:hypothetical protein
LDVKNIVGSQRPSMDGAILRPEWISPHQRTLKDEWMVCGQETLFLLSSSFLANHGGYS